MDGGQCFARGQVRSRAAVYPSGRHSLCRLPGSKSRVLPVCGGRKNGERGGRSARGKRTQQPGGETVPARFSPSSEVEASACPEVAVVESIVAAEQREGAGALLPSASSREEEEGASGGRGGSGHNAGAAAARTGDAAAGRGDGENAAGEDAVVEEEHVEEIHISEVVDDEKRKQIEVRV